MQLPVSLDWNNLFNPRYYLELYTFSVTFAIPALRPIRYTSLCVLAEYTPVNPLSPDASTLLNKHQHVYCVFTTEIFREFYHLIHGGFTCIMFVLQRTSDIELDLWTILINIHFKSWNRIQLYDGNKCLLQDIIHI